MCGKFKSFKFNKTRNSNFLQKGWRGNQSLSRSEGVCHATGIG